MLTLIIRPDSALVAPGIELIHDADDPPHIVVVDERGEWTDSPSVFTRASESEQDELIAAYRNEGYEDRNP